MGVFCLCISNASLRNPKNLVDALRNALFLAHDPI